MQALGPFLLHSRLDKVLNSNISSQLWAYWPSTLPSTFSIHGVLGSFCLEPSDFRACKGATGAWTHTVRDFSPNQSQLLLSTHSHVLSPFQAELWYVFSDLLHHLRSWKIIWYLPTPHFWCTLITLGICAWRCLASLEGLPTHGLGLLEISTNVMPDTTFNIENWVQSFLCLL